MNPKVYLAGPVKGLDYNSAMDWREKAKEELAKHNIIGVSPMRHREFLKEAKELDSNKKIENPLHEQIAGQKGLTARARHDVMNADAILVNFLGAEKVSIGTAIELAWADILRKPKVIVIEHDNNVHEHAMINELADYRVQTLEEGIHIIKTILLH